MYAKMHTEVVRHRIGPQRQNKEPWMTATSGGARLAGRAAIVTGAARGIGAAIARTYVSHGAQVLIADVLDEDGERLAAELGDAARYAHLDVRSRVDWERAENLLRVSTGLATTVLVHNAGVMTAGSVVDATPQALTDAFAVNVLGPVIGTQVCLDGMIEFGGGSIIVVSSIAAISVGPGFIPYAISKAANAAYARAAARELGRFGIRVNSLLPGGTESAMNSGGDLVGLDKNAWFERMTIPRIGRPDEIADAALFLAGSESSYVTGTQLVVDGGQLLGPSAAWKA
jgi:3alpha(or 20beta)-hydroxysteroid dehydrogenase